MSPASYAPGSAEGEFLAQPIRPRPYHPPLSHHMREGQTCPVRICRAFRLIGPAVQKYAGEKAAQEEPSVDSQQRPRARRYAATSRATSGSDSGRVVRPPTRSALGDSLSRPFPLAKAPATRRRRDPAPPTTSQGPRFTWDLSRSDERGAQSIARGGSTAEIAHELLPAEPTVKDPRDAHALRARLTRPRPSRRVRVRVRRGARPRRSE
jgi:hypothetical protein